MVLSRFIAFALALLASVSASSVVADTLLVEFTSATCAPCRAMQPVMQELAAAGHAIREVDIARDAALAARFKVTSVPTFIVLVDGHERARWEGGGKTTQQLAEMIRKSEELAAAAGNRDLALVNNPFPAAEGPPKPQTFVPTPGKVVPLQSETAIYPPSTSGRAAASSQPSGPATADVGALISATVRLSIEDPEGKSTGTGTIIDARQNKALVLTCGHLFRESAGKGAITLSFFSPGPSGAVLRGTAEATLIDYDLERDLALVCFVTDSEVTVATVAPAGTTLEVGSAATSVGCGHGENPTPWPTRITAVDRYQGHPNVEAAGAPVEGRSGGGLFNAAGQLIGVCNAADPQGNEGLYASLPSIHAKLDGLGLSFVHQTPSTGNPQDPASTGPTLAATAEPSAGIAIRGQDPAPANSTLFPSARGDAAARPGTADAAPQAASETAVAATLADSALMTDAERAALAEVARRGADSEVIFIIRPRTPGGRSEVIKLDQASPAFVRALSSAGATGAP